LGKSLVTALLDPTVDRLTILAAEEAGFLIAWCSRGSFASILVLALALVRLDRRLARVTGISTGPRAPLPGTQRPRRAGLRSAHHRAPFDR
jgi:hypothetical protein